MMEVVKFQGMSAVRWRSEDGACAIATLQGAHLVSWIPAGGRECLYVSEKSPFEPGRAIRGGVPVCFPQFADRGPLIQHGFARTRLWTLKEAAAPVAGISSVTFELESSSATQSMWPHKFRVFLVATVGGNRLDLGLRVVNAGIHAFSFTAALHTYLRVADAATAVLTGLRDRRYQNRGEQHLAVEERESFTGRDPVDRVYFAAPPATQLQDKGRSFRIEQRGFTDTVVWNPGAEKTSKMPDMPRDGYKHMLCVEAAVVEPPVMLASAAEWSGGQTIVVSG